MVHASLRIDVIQDAKLSAAEKAEILSLCNRAFERAFEAMMKTFLEPVHVIGYLDGVIVSHAMWVTRWLQVGDAEPLRTAYVEMVVVEPAQQRQSWHENDAKASRRDRRLRPCGALARPS